MNIVKILFLAVSVIAAVHCGNVGIYDEATATYYRVVRNGLNEWYPLNGNLSSRIGSADGTATAGYSAGTNRSGESGKAVCTTSARLDFSQQTFRSSPASIGVWIKFNTLPTGISILQNGQTGTSWYGFKISLTSAALPMTFSDGLSLGSNFTGPSVTTGVWYYLVFTYGSGSGAYYFAPYGGSLALHGTASSAYAPSAVAMSIFSGAVDACVDDLVNYNRALSADEVKQNFLSVE